MKYIVIQTEQKDYAYIFPNFIQHIDFAVEIINKHDLQGTIVGAGFVVYKDHQFSCYGKSMSLNIKSRENDTQIISKFFDHKFFEEIAKTKIETDVFNFY